MSSYNWHFLSPGYHPPPLIFNPEEARALDKIKVVMGDPEKEHLNTLSDHIKVLKTSPRACGWFPNDLLSSTTFPVFTHC